MIKLKASPKKEGLPKGGDQFVEAFARGLGVIRAFAGQADALTLSEIAGLAGVAPATARRLLYTLVSLGYVRTEGRHFRLTPRVMELGYSYLSSLPLRDHARPLIDAYSREIGEVCSLSVLDGSDVVYIERAEIRSPLARSVHVGDRLPAHATSSGHVLFTGVRPDVLEDFLKLAPFPAWTPKTLCDRQALLHAIHTAEKQGWSLAAEELELGICGLAVPVVDHDRSALAALTISVSLAKYTPETILERFLPGLQDIARKLGMG